MGGIVLKRGILGLVIGIFIGLSIVAVPAYGAVKQYILTEFTQPVLVNGKKYQDKDNPVLSYKGRTYIPLAKIGDLTGVEYRYNSEKKQVEIGKASNSGVAGREGDVLMPDTVIKEEAVPGYKGHADSEDASYQWALTMNREANDYPPLLSEGWISVGMLDKIEGVYFGGSGKENIMIFSNKSLIDQKIYKTITLTEEFNSKSDGEFLISSIHIKKYYENIFFSIADLKTQGIIQ